MVRVLLAGGGTAGHTSPLLATAHALQAHNPAVEITCLGTSRGLETTLIPEAGYALELVPPVPFPRRPNMDLVRLPGRLYQAWRAARNIVDRIRPDVICGFGGYVSVPAYLAARSRHVPLVVHEGNAVAGMANRLGARFTHDVAVSFPATPLRHGKYIGLPIREQIAILDRPALRAQAREFFGLAPHQPTLLVTGGSQGARRINHAVSQAGPDLASAGIQVLHAAGRLSEVTWRPEDSGPKYVLQQFISRMDLAYAAADAIICRAGANTVTEVAAVGLPAVFVPLPIGNGEQALNASAIIEAGGGMQVNDGELTSEWITSQVIPLLQDPARLEQMSNAALDVIRDDAAQVLASMIMRAAESKA